MALAIGLALLAWWAWPTAQPELGQDELVPTAGATLPIQRPLDPGNSPDATESRPAAGPRDDRLQVSGRACSSTGDALPETIVHAELLLATSPEAEPIASADLQATPEGAFEWSPAAPRSAATLRLVARAPRCVGAQLVVDVPPRGTELRDLVVAIEALDAAAAGSVLDSEGAPLPGARVVLAGTPYALAAVCDAEGRYSLSLPSALGPLRLHAFAERHAPGIQDVLPAARTPARADFVLFPESVLRGRVRDRQGHTVADALLRTLGTVRVETRSDAAGAYALAQLEADAERPFRIRVSARGHVAHDFEVPGGTLERDFTLEKGVSLQGLVVDELETAVAGATITLVGQAGVDRSTTAVSAADGSFALDAVPHGSFTLLVERRDHAAQLVTASADSGEPIRIRLERGGEVRGSVHDSRGAPIAGVRLAFGSLLAGGPRYSITAVSNASGAFEARGVPREGARVEIAKAGYEPVAVVVAGSGTGYRFVLQRYGVLAGRVLEARSNAPLQEFKIRVFGAELGPAAARDTWPPPEPGAATAWELAVASPDGRFATRPEQHRLRAGTFVDVEATAEGHSAARLERVLVTEYPEDDRCVFRLALGSVVRGRVLIDSGDDPVRGAAVALVQEGRTDLVAITDRAGEFQITGVPAGLATLRVTHPRWPEKVDGPFEVGAAGSVVERVVRLPLGETLEGVVLDQDGAPVPNAELRLQLVDRGRIRTPRATFVSWSYGTPVGTTADGQGKYRFTRLVPGKYVLEHTERLGTLRLACFQATLDLARGETKLDLDPRAGRATLRVRATRGGAAPELDVATVVEATEPASGPARRSWGAWVVKGTAEIRGLAATEYRVTYRGTTRTITLREDAVTEIVLGAR